ncbi:putative paired box protein [Danaus plexippus plexippus]|uniref:Paired box protein n=1 Tax=Danaus plexippus plexippus TaxID=278856 RepID=A0A212F4E9_DANPL|nr:putative paired box protein [Danaus plexippus plexippus]
MRSKTLVWFQNRRAKFRKQERLAQQKAGETPVKAEGKRDKPGSPATSPHPPPSQPTHHSLPHLSPPDLKPITSAANKLCEELNGSEPPVSGVGSGKWSAGCGLLRQPSGFPLLGVAPPNYLLSDHLGTLAKTNNHLF